MLTHTRNLTRLTHNLLTHRVNKQRYFSYTLLSLIIFIVYDHTRSVTPNASSIGVRTLEETNKESFFVYCGQKLTCFSYKPSSV